MWRGVSTPDGLASTREKRVGGFTQRRQWQPTPVLLPGNSHGQRSPVGCSPWGRTESDTTESLGSRMPMPLGKQVFFAGVAASGSCAIVYYLVQKTFSRASYYQLALEQLHSHPEALEALGTPLNVHYLKLTDKYNFVDIADAKLKIPVSGPKSEGHLYVSSSRDAPFKRWNLQEVFLELKDGQQIPLFKPSRDNDEVKKE
ncbi:cytochrome c oxidase assembly factor 1 homolog isoform X1 [Odocoileus virginianus]|uniref:Cytochrome c oxidase assembly factor 1 homolog isoform X1 n=2 Tax=Odocoileus virginianus TaxID=9874 RepID=A0ABM4I5K8_ODOVR